MRSRPARSASTQADHDETAYARIVAERFATQHRTRTVSSDDFALIDTLVAAFDEPFADASALATWRVCELARESVTVALSGDGADEALRRLSPLPLLRRRGARARAAAAGAARRRVRHARAALPKADWRRAASAPIGLCSRSPKEASSPIPRPWASPAPRCAYRLYSDAARRQLAGHAAEQRYIDTMRRAPARDALDRGQYADFVHWLPGDILTKLDRTSMGVSLEAREPLLDHHLVQFAALCRRGWPHPSRAGQMADEAGVRAWLPREILYRPKMGFVTPVLGLVPRAARRDRRRSRPSRRC